MAGTRQDGILLTDDVGGGGGGIPVTIQSPIGQDVMANSVSVAIASDQSPVPVVGEDTAGIVSSGVGINIVAVQGNPTITPLTPNGTAKIPITNSSGVLYTSVTNEVQVTTTTPVDQGLANLNLPEAWPIRITDTVETADVTAANALKTDSSHVIQPVSGTISISGTVPIVPTQEDRDIFVASTTKVIPTAGVYNDGLSNLSAGEIATPRMTYKRALHTHLRDVNDQVISASSLNSSFLPNTNIGLNVNAELFLRNQDSSVTAWEGNANPYSATTANYPYLKALRTHRIYPEVVIAGFNGQIIADIAAYSFEAAWFYVRSSNLIGTIKFLTTPGDVGFATKVYDTNQGKWITGEIVNPTIDTLYVVPCSGLESVILRCTAYTSGSLRASCSGGPGVAALYANVSGSIISTKNALLGTTAPAAVAVGVGSALAVAANANRKGLVLTNTSVNNISIGFGANAAVLNSGITLIPAICPQWKMDEYTYSQEAINAIAAGAGSNLAIQELL